MSSNEVDCSISQRASGSKEVWFLIGLAPTLFLVMVALRAPLDSIDRMPALADMLRFLGEYVPSLRGYVELSAHSQATALYFLCAWILLLPQTAIWLFVMFRYAKVDRLCGSNGKRDLIKLTLVWMLSAGGVFVALYGIPHEWSVVEQWGVSDHRVCLAFFGSLAFLFVAVGIGFVINALFKLTFVQLDG